MARFGYLEGKDAKKAAKKARKLEKAASAGKKADERRRSHAEEGSGKVEVVYVRRETIRAAWRELKAEGGESLSELVDDLLLGWLQERQVERAGSAAPLEDSD
ncbi:hypothetical protein Deipr_0824 [Deinococcus proteolyticus MRP]|uniref:Uncharacterized protein n=1 Tax=Deinococcus proteolyticus (strain ATCC 35074 / DSM 20540 / JCM 6276 / NBRC 101906 / NCIMB 13154 / VKM Ac-1939 / CCM 2703 / MRP) TaxID=693977 RepID=F0RM60_DEIPM|nr:MULTISPECIES: hypothetical protein [Deinococcus]ADY25980.1 hypothetical protein Deipr_0824 [Deinococcus proteolyticus MRP]MCY1702101.1 hypothetical protein [Deinococcus sp. SL84]